MVLDFRLCEIEKWSDFILWIFKKWLNVNYFLIGFFFFLQILVVFYDSIFFKKNSKSHSTLQWMNIFFFFSLQFFFPHFITQYSFIYLFIYFSDLHFQILSFGIGGQLLFPLPTSVFISFFLAFQFCDVTKVVIFHNL